MGRASNENCKARRVPKNGTMDYLRLASDSGDPMGAFPVSIAVEDQKSSGDREIGPSAFHAHTMIGLRLYVLIDWGLAQPPHATRTAMPWTIRFPVY